eukprot:gene23387-biopygen7286
MCICPKASMSATQAGPLAPALPPVAMCYQQRQPNQRPRGSASRIVPPAINHQCLLVDSSSIIRSSNNRAVCVLRTGTVAGAGWGRCAQPSSIPVRVAGGGPPMSSSRHFVPTVPPDSFSQQFLTVATVWKTCCGKTPPSPRRPHLVGVRDRERRDGAQRGSRRSRSRDRRRGEERGDAAKTANGRAGRPRRPAAGAAPVIAVVAAAGAPSCAAVRSAPRMSLERQRSGVPSQRRPRRTSDCHESARTGGSSDNCGRCPGHFYCCISRERGDGARREERTAKGGTCGTLFWSLAAAAGPPPARLFVQCFCSSSPRPSLRPVLLQFLPPLPAVPLVAALPPSAPGMGGGGGAPPPGVTHARATRNRCRRSLAAERRSVAGRCQHLCPPHINKR